MSSSKCNIRLLDDEEEIIIVDYQPRSKGQFLLDYVCRELGVIEKDYFGIRYVDTRGQRRWMDLTRSISRQVKDMDPVVVCFRIKYYPPEPFRLRDETRHQIYLQLKRDLQHGRLYSPGPGQEMALLAALCVQIELGDFDPELHPNGYISGMRLLLQQSEKLEEKIAEIHQGASTPTPNGITTSNPNVNGLTAHQAQIALLRRSCVLDTYGVDPHAVKDQAGNQLYLGVNHTGVLTFHGGRKQHHFRWCEITKLNYEGKMFIVHFAIAEDSRTKKKHTVGFKCTSSSTCRHLWRLAVEHRLFFTLSSSAEIPTVVTGGSFFSRGSRVRYSGRVERELSEDLALWANRSQNRGYRGRIKAPPLSKRAMTDPMIVRQGSKVSDGVPNSDTEGTLTNEGEKSELRSDIEESVYAEAEDLLDQLRGSHVRHLSVPVCDDRSSAGTRSLASLGLDDYGQPIDYSDTASSRIDYHQIRDSFEQSSSGSQAESTSSYHFLSQRDYEEYYGHRYRYDRYYEPQPRSHSLDHRLQRRLAMRTDLVEKADSVETVLTVVENSKPMEAKPKNRKERMMSQFKTFWNSKFNKLSAKMRKKTCNPAKIFIPAFMSIAMSLAAMVVIVFETENEFFASARRVPELVILRREYYEPAKDYIVEKWRSIFR